MSDDYPEITPPCDARTVAALTSEHIRQSNLIEGIHREEEIDQTWEAWRFLMDQPRITHGVIRETQRIITANQPELQENERGAYRNVSRVNVTVGAYEPPHYADVQELMDDWVGDLPNRTPWEGHVDFESIHPFVDGNGRTGRALMWREQVLAGEEPTMLLAAERWGYYEQLNLGRKMRAAKALENWKP